MRGRATDAPRCCRRWKPISNASMRSGTTAGGALARAADRGCSVTTRSRMPCTLRSCCASRPTQPAPPRQRAGTWRACSRTARCRNGCRPPSRSRGRSPSTKSADAAAARCAARPPLPAQRARCDTEELWFPEWELGGPQYENPQGYEAVNPVDFVSRWRTPMLVIHGEQDFRIPYPQGIAAFTALQRRGIESKLLLFPDENHWVLKPANSILWYHTVLGWLDTHLKD